MYGLKVTAANRYTVKLSALWPHSNAIKVAIFMLFLAIDMYLVTFDLIKKKKIGAGANFGEGRPEK